ncbi:TetR/AcrR family transcriptional regulator [Acrocarpospora pleiomorpha]|uniref:TetR/AcrR family transcriptional regulator n=1 Tax=Acrocarpospora pleiomorpha TaxID=90975 RepID=UPI0012D2DF86|nr:TetR/AcrR family transcriptional regulator [Acrocarpospora pleiomorpha]
MTIPGSRPTLEPRESAPRGRGRPRDIDADARILRAALHVLSREGFASMSMDAVAERSGVSKPSIYRRWSTKIELATAAIATMSNDDPPTTEADAWKALLTELRLFERAVSRDHGMSIIGTLLAHEEQQPGMIALYREQVVRARRNRVRAVLDRGIREGQFPEDIDVNLVLNMMFGYYYASYIGGEPQPADWPDRCVDLVRRATEAR